MAITKKPKKLKYPKKPKANASISTMENYLAKRKEVDKLNASRMSEFNKMKSKRESLKKAIAKV